LEEDALSRMAHAHGTMRILLVSDTHGFLDPRIAELAQDCDAAAHAGDIGSAAVLTALRPRGGTVVAVRGNNDTPAKWNAEDAGALSALIEVARLELPGGDLIVTHGDTLAPKHRHARLRQAYPRARAILYGHSHRLLCDTDAQPWILNAGASGRTRTYGGPSCLLLRAGARDWRVEEIRFPKLR
jgi:uncharacterized protein